MVTQLVLIFRIETRKMDHMSTIETHSI